jgi:hypothetical protein
MHIRVLPRPPISGSIREHQFDARGDCTWVEFELDDGTTWAGAFGEGRITKQHRAAVPFADGRTVLVIAGGQGYVVDVERCTLNYRTKCDFWDSALAVPERDFVIAAEFTTATVIGRERELWKSERIALDGIILDSSTPAELRGKVWQVDGWHAFTLRYDGFVYEQGSFITKDWFACTRASP